MASTFLTPDDVSEMTGKVQHRAQAKALNSLGVIYKIRADGSILVLRAHVEQLLGLDGDAQSKRPEFTANWDAANAMRPSTK